MSRRLLVVSTALLAAGGLALGLALQQEFQPPKPTKFHEYLKSHEGTWDTLAKFSMGPPGTPPTESKGVSVERLTAGGLWLIQDVKGDMGGQEFIGHGLMGYDTYKKKYVGCWIDSMSTALYPSEGTVDESGKVFTAIMEGPDPSQGGKMVKEKMVTEITGKDTKKLTFYRIQPDGKEQLSGTIEFKRKK